MKLTEASMVHHMGIVLLLLWLLNAFDCCNLLAYFIALVYLYQVHERYDMRLRRKLRYEENKAANQKRLLADSETVRWLNHAVAKIWPICMEQIVSQRIFLRIIPWFLNKYKPWTAKQAVVQHLYLGRNPPLVTDMRVLRESTGDDHLVIELGLNFLTAHDMSAILYAKLRRRLGFGIMTKMHLTGMHVEGKVLVGVKFLHSWPFIRRLRVSFAEPPYFQVTVKPIFNHGLDVTEVPGIAGWLDKLLAIAFEETLVEPNMLVVDLEKFVSPQSEDWFSVVVKEPIAYVNVEVIEAAELKPSDSNGLADPYVKGHLGPYRFKTQTQKKTLTPKWQEEFKIPICSWDSQNVLAIVVRDKDYFVDAALGDCSVKINDLRDGQRHEIWLPLENVKMGRLHLAVTVVETNAEASKQQVDEMKIANEIPDSPRSKTAQQVESGSKMAKQGPSSTVSLKKPEKIADTFEPVDIKGQKETGISIHHPGSETFQAWERRKGRSRHLDTEIFPVEGTKLSIQQSPPESDSNSSDESKSGPQKGKLSLKIRKHLHKLLHKHPNREDPWNSFGDSCLSPTPCPSPWQSPRQLPIEKPIHTKNLRASQSLCHSPLPNVNPIHTKKLGAASSLCPSPQANVKPIHTKNVGATAVVSDSLSEPLSAEAAEGNMPETPNNAKGNLPETPSKYHMKDRAKSMFKNAGKSARSLKQVLSKKGSRKFSENSEGLGVESGYSSGDDDSISSSVCAASSEGIPITSSVISRTDNDDAEPIEHVTEAAEDPPT